MNKNYVNIIRNKLTKSSGLLTDADYKEAMDFLTKIEENNDLLKNVYKNLQKMFEEKDSVQKRINDAFEVTKEFYNVKKPINKEGYSNAEKGAYIKDLMDELRTSYTNDKADIAMPYTALETLIKGWDAISHGKDSLTFIRPDADQLKQAFENGDWTFDEMIKGYGEFTSSELPSDVLVINKIDDMMVFDSDADAAVQARKDGIKLIPVHHLHFEDSEDIRAYYESVFIDNEINHEFLKDSLITDERQVLNNAIEFFKNDKGVEALELPGELLNAAEIYESSIEDRKSLFIDPVSGNKLLVEDATNGYLTNLFDKNNTLIDHDSFTGYKKEEDGYSTDAMSRFEAGLVTLQAFQQLGIWGDYHDFDLSRNQNIINELEEEIKNSFDNNDFDIGTKEYLGNLLSASMETLDFKPNEWKFLINSGASCSAALHTAASDAYLGDNLMWLLDNIPEPELDKIRKNEKLSLEIVRIAEDSIMNDSNFSVKPTLILAEKLGQLNHAVEYISDLYDKNKDEYQNDQNFTEMYNELTDYAHKVNWTIHYVDRIPDEDNDTYSNRFDIEIYNDDEYLRDSLHLEDDSIFNGHFNVSLVVDVPENFNSLNIQELKSSDIDVSYIRIEDKENGYPEEQDIILKEDLLSLFKSNVIQTLREFEQIHDSKQIYIDNPRSNREQMEVNTSLNLYYNNELKDEIDKGNHLINDNAWIGYFKISDSLKYEIVTGSYDGNTIIDLRPTVDTNINNLKGINGKGKINDEEVYVEYRDSEDKEINLDSHWISYTWKDLESLNSNQIKEKFIKDIETHINNSKVLPSLACDYEDFERPYDISLVEIENINKLYKDTTNILSKLKTVEDARECEKHYGVWVEIGCDDAGGGLHCTDSLFDNVKPENIEWFRIDQWYELGYVYYPTDGSKPRFDYYRTGEEEALIEDITISEFNNIYLKKDFVLSPSLFAELFNKSVSQDSIIQMDEQAAKAILDSCAEDFGLVYKAGDIYSINGEYKKGLPIEPIEILRHSIIAREEKASSLKDAKIEFIWNLIGTPGGKEKKERIVVDNLKDVFEWYKNEATEKDEFDFIELVNKNPDWTKLNSKESLVIANKLFDFLSCHHDDHFDRKSMIGDDYRYYMDKELISNILEEKSLELNGKELYWDALRELLGDERTLNNLEKELRESYQKQYSSYDEKDLKEDVVSRILEDSFNLYGFDTPLEGIDDSPFAFINEHDVLEAKWDMIDEIAEDVVKGKFESYIAIENAWEEKLCNNKIFIGLILKDIIEYPENLANNKLLLEKELEFINSKSFDEIVTELEIKPEILAEKYANVLNNLDAINHLQIATTTFTKEFILNALEAGKSYEEINSTKNAGICFNNDKEKMADFRKLTKEEFLKSYSYLEEADYNLTKEIFDRSKVCQGMNFPCGFTFPDNADSKEKQIQYYEEITDKLCERFGINTNEFELQFFEKDNITDASFNFNFALSVPYESQFPAYETDKWIKSICDELETEYGAYLNFEGGERVERQFDTPEECVKYLSEEKKLSTLNLDDREFLNKFSFENGHSEAEVYSLDTNSFSPFLKRESLVAYSEIKEHYEKVYEREIKDVLTKKKSFRDLDDFDNIDKVISDKYKTSELSKRLSEIKEFRESFEYEMANNILKQHEKDFYINIDKTILEKNLYETKYLGSDKTVSVCFDTKIEKGSILESVFDTNVETDLFVDVEFDKLGQPMKFTIREESSEDGEALNCVYSNDLNFWLKEALESRILKNVDEYCRKHGNGLSFKEAYCLDPKPVEILTKEDAVALVNLFEKNKPGNEYPIFDLPAAQKIIEYFEAEDYVIYKDEEGKLCIYDNSEDFNGEGDIYSNKEFLKFARSLAEKAEELGYEVYTEGSKKLLERITTHYEELDLQNKHISQEENAEKYLQTVKSLLPESENINRKTIREVLIASEKAKNILKEAHTESYVQEWEKQKRKKYPEKNNDFGREN